MYLDQLNKLLYDIRLNQKTPFEENKRLSQQDYQQCRNEDKSSGYRFSHHAFILKIFNKSEKMI